MHLYWLNFIAHTASLTQGNLEHGTLSFLVLFAVQCNCNLSSLNKNKYTITKRYLSVLSYQLSIYAYQTHQICSSIIWKLGLSEICEHLGYVHTRTVTSKPQRVTSDISPPYILLTCVVFTVS